MCAFITAGILKPTVAGSSQSSNQHPEKLVSDDLDSSLANLVGSKCDLFEAFHICFFMGFCKMLAFIIVKYNYFADLGIGNGTTKK